MMISFRGDRFTICDVVNYSIYFAEISKGRDAKMQRTFDEMMALIMDLAVNDERIRAVTMEGSQANNNAVRDEYSDFDISYVVTDVREFTKDRKWLEYFGEILIVQCPCDWYSHPYDFNGHDNFTYLIQFKDGNRIDLSLIDIRNLAKEAEKDEPRIVLLNKDGFKELVSSDNDTAFCITKPTEKEYQDTCNEFRWLSIYITKGLCRKQLYYAKYMYDVLVMAMFIKMLNWKIGVDNDFNVATGSAGKYLGRFLNESEMNRFSGVFPDGTYPDIWNKLFLMYDYFAENARYVGDALGYDFDEEEYSNVRGFLKRRENGKNTETY